MAAASRRRPIRTGTCRGSPGRRRARARPRAHTGRSRRRASRPTSRRPFGRQPVASRRLRTRPRRRDPVGRIRQDAPATGSAIGPDGGRWQALVEIGQEDRSPTCDRSIRSRVRLSSRVTARPNSVSPALRGSRQPSASRFAVMHDRFAMQSPGLRLDVASRLSARCGWIRGCCTAGFGFGVHLLLPWPIRSIVTLSAVYRASCAFHDTEVGLEGSGVRAILGHVPDRPRQDASCHAEPQHDADQDRRHPDGSLRHSG